MVVFLCLCGLVEVCFSGCLTKERADFTLKWAFRLPRHQYSVNGNLRHRAHAVGADFKQGKRERFFAVAFVFRNHVAVGLQLAARALGKHQHGIAVGDGGVNGIRAEMARQRLVAQWCV